jgi:16S rRNA (guanine966-N2)-methyltransferase
MRINAGYAKGTPLACPRSGLRPTADRIREAIFSSLGDQIVGASVLDLFAGTGALGLEAASRGAREVTLVEKSRPALLVIEQNVSALTRNAGVTCRITVVRGEVFSKVREFGAAQRQFGLIFADPPYGDVAQELLDDLELPRLLRAGGRLILESAARDPLTVGAPWQLTREAVYGDTQISFLVRA